MPLENGIVKQLNSWIENFDVTEKDSYTWIFPKKRIKTGLDHP
jgi:hypothetical protein